MPQLSKSTVSLRLFGEDLDPDEISRELGQMPTSFIRKGEPRKSGARAREGSWLMRAQQRRPADLDAQITQIFGPLNSDLSLWKRLVERYRVDLFCGLFLTEGNEGVLLSPETLRMAADRNVAIGFDIYALNGHEAGQ